MDSPDQGAGTDPSATPVANTAPAQPAPAPTTAPPGGGTPVANENYQAPASIPPAPNGGSAVQNPHYTPPAQKAAPPSTPPPGGGTAVANPHYTPTDGKPLDPAATDLSTVPLFIRQNVDMNKVVQKPVSAGDQDTGKEAEVNNYAPHTVNVYDPKNYTQHDRDHELTHVFQATRNLATGQLGLIAGTPRSWRMTTGEGSDEYDYGGQGGLEHALRHGKGNITHYNMEQQAQIVADYKQKHDEYLAKAKAGTATKDDLQRMSDIQRVYHPYIEQLARVSDSTMATLPSAKTILGIGKPEPLGPVPNRTPGLPSFDTPGLGVMQADPLMGGGSAAIPTKAAPAPAKKKK